MKRTFLLGQAMVNSIAGAFQHAKVYRPHLSESNRLRKNVRDKLSARIRDAVGRYRHPVDDAAHCTTIQELAECMTRDFEHCQVLRDNRFRVGIAQKALNLYLKYLWCLDEIAEPPHCPIDRQVISSLGIPEKERLLFNWTTLDRIDQYRDIIERCRIAAGATSIAQWELNLWRFEGEERKPKVGVDTTPSLANTSKADG